MKYEIMFIVRPDMEENAQKDLIKSYDKLLKDNGAKIDSFKELGQKEFAYEIKNHKSGFIFFMKYHQRIQKHKKNLIVLLI